MTEIELRLLWPRTLGEAKPPISGTIYWGAHTNTHNYTITHTHTDTWTHTTTKIKIHVETQADTQKSSRSS